MKQLLLIIIVLLSINCSLSAQEEKGEGDIFIENNPNATRVSTVNGTEVKDGNIEYTFTSSDINEEHRYVVEPLFTNLSFDDVKKKAKSEHIAYYIDFTAEWCAPCKMMEKTTFRDYNVVDFTKQNFIAVQLDITDFDAIELQAMYNVTSLPTILFFDSEGNLTGRTTGLQTGTLFFQKLQEMHNFF